MDSDRHEATATLTCIRLAHTSMQTDVKNLTMKLFRELILALKGVGVQ